MTHTCLILVSCLLTGCQCTWDYVSQELLICALPADRADNKGDVTESGVGSEPGASSGPEAGSEGDVTKSNVGSNINLEASSESDFEFHESEADSVESGKSVANSGEESGDKR